MEAREELEYAETEGEVDEIRQANASESFILENSSISPYSSLFPSMRLDQINRVPPRTCPLSLEFAFPAWS